LQLTFVFVVDHVKGFIYIGTERKMI